MQVAVAFRPLTRLNGDATSTMDAIVKVSRENLALAVLWGAIGACALMTLFSPKLTTPGIGGSSLGASVASLVSTGF